MPSMIILRPIICALCLLSGSCLRIMPSKRVIIRAMPFKRVIICAGWFTRRSFSVYYAACASFSLYIMTLASIDIHANLFIRYSCYLYALLNAIYTRYSMLFVRSTQCYLYALLPTPFEVPS